MQLFFSAGPVACLSRSALHISRRHTITPRVLSAVTVALYIQRAQLFDSPSGPHGETRRGEYSASASRRNKFPFPNYKTELLLRAADTVEKAQIPLLTHTHIYVINVNFNIKKKKFKFKRALLRSARRRVESEIGPGFADATRRAGAEMENATNDG